MDQIFDNLRQLNYSSFFYLNDFAKQSSFWSNLIFWFADYGIVLIIVGLIYLIVCERINALFAAVLSSIFSVALGFILWLFWYSQSATGYSTGPIIANSFPSIQIYLSFAIATTLILYGNKKIGLATLFVALCISVARVANGFHYPSAILFGAVIGIFAGTLAYWFMEHFEDFWANNSAE